MSDGMGALSPDPPSAPPNLTELMDEAAWFILSSLGDAGVAVADRARIFAGGSIKDDGCLLLTCYISQSAPGI